MSGSTRWTILDRLFAFTIRRDGQSHFLQQEAIEVEVGEPVERPAVTTPPRRLRTGREPQRILLESLASKALHAWLQNRHQTLYPLTLNLHVLSPEARALVMRLVAASALADGQVPSAEERDRVSQDLADAGAAEADLQLLAATIERPEPLPPLLQALQEAQLGAHAYAASLVALGRRSEVSRAWLDYLAARLGLPAQVTSGLERRRRWRR